MTGTSLDALDVAVVRIDGHGLTMRAALVKAGTQALGDLAGPLRAMAEQTPMCAGEMAGISRRLSLLHAEAIARVWAECVSEAGFGAGANPDLIAVHGQTVFHAPPVSWQMLTPSVIARAMGAPVVFDLRAADLAAGGQGAPITPLADWVLFRDAHEARAVANLGGFCNLTLMGPEQADGMLVDAAAREGVVVQGVGTVRGFDLCACNHVLDTIARRVMGVRFDDGGKQALWAEPDHDAQDDLMGIFAAQRGGMRSLGTGDDDVMSWIGRHRGRVSGATLAATACEAIGQVIAREVVGGRLILAGGGVKNAALVAAISSCCSCRMVTTQKLGVPVEYREAMAMAVLGALSQDRVPITLKRVTGVDEPPVAGSWVLP